MIKNNQKTSEKWKIRQLAEVVDNFIVPMRDKPKVFSGNIPWCRIEDFNGIYLSDSKSNQYVNKQTIDKMKLRVYPTNTVLVSCSADLGRCAITTKPLVTNQTFIGLVPSKTLNSLFLYYLMSFNATRLNKLSSGTTISYLSRKQFEDLKVTIPTKIETQQKIADILFSIDQAIQKTEEIIEKSEKLKKGLMNDLLTRGIGHKKFKKTKLGEIPEEWTIEILSDTDIKIIDGDRGVNYPKKEEFQNRGYCLFLSTKNIVNDVFNFKDSIFITRERDNLLRKGKLQKYDVVLTTRGTVGNVAFFDDSVPYQEIRINSGMLIFRAEKSLDSQFLYFLMKSPLMKKTYSNLGSGSAQPQLPISSLKNLQIAVPPIDEQKQIATKLQLLDRKYDKEKEFMSILLNLKNGLMHDIFNQKVEVENVA